MQIRKIYFPKNWGPVIIYGRGVDWVQKWEGIEIFLSIREWASKNIEKPRVGIEILFC